MNITKKREKEKFSLFNSLYRNFLADATVKLYSFLKWNFIIIYKAADASFYRLQKDIMLLEPKKSWNHFKSYFDFNGEKFCAWKAEESEA